MQFTRRMKMNMTIFAVMDSLLMGLLYAPMMLLRVHVARFFSPVSRHTQGNVQTTVESGIDIAGRC